jgi:hypothetical protein
MYMFISMQHRAQQHIAHEGGTSHSGRGVRSSLLFSAHHVLLVVEEGERLGIERERSVVEKELF